MHRVAEFLLGLPRRVGVEDARLGLHHLAHRPEGDSLPEGETAALPPPHDVGPAIDHPPELVHEPALAHARFTDDRDQLR